MHSYAQSWCPLIGCILPKARLKMSQIYVSGYLAKHQASIWGAQEVQTETFPTLKLHSILAAERSAHPSCTYFWSKQMQARSNTACTSLLYIIAFLASLDQDTWSSTHASIFIISAFERTSCDFFKQKVAGHIKWGANMKSTCDLQHDSRIRCTQYSLTLIGRN